MGKRETSESHRYVIRLNHAKKNRQVRPRHHNAGSPACFHPYHQKKESEQGTKLLRQNTMQNHYNPTHEKSQVETPSHHLHAPVTQTPEEIERDLQTIQQMEEYEANKYVAIDIDEHYGYKW